LLISNNILAVSLMEKVQKKNQIGVNVCEGRSKRCVNFELKRLKLKADGSTVFWHWNSIVFHVIYDVFSICGEVNHLGIHREA